MLGKRHMLPHILFMPRPVMLKLAPSLSNCALCRSWTGKVLRVFILAAHPWKANSSSFLLPEVGAQSPLEWTPYSISISTSCVFCTHFLSSLSNAWECFSCPLPNPRWLAASSSSFRGNSTRPAVHPPETRHLVSSHLL